MIDHGGSHAVVDDAGRSGRSSRQLLWTRIVSLVVMAGLMVRLAWLSDDSLITLRTALNASHGLGLGFNVGEAVQAYTHPLWFLLWTGVGAVSGEWVVTILLLSVTLSLLAVGIVLWRAPSSWVVIAAAASLVLSNAFMEYATSGLENPLAYAFAAAAIALTAPAPASFRGAPWKSILVGLCLAGLVLTRFDLALLVAPVGVVILWRARRSVRLVLPGIAATVVPLIVWLAWTWSVYGSLLPNTFEAKRNLDIPQVELAKEGVRYLVVSGLGDMWTIVILVLGLGFTLAKGSMILRGWAIGATLYVAYIVFVGGDFMAGRFLAVPVLVSVACVVEAARNHTSSEQTSEALGGASSSRELAGSALAFLLVPLLILAVARALPTAVVAPDEQRWDNQFSAGVADERGFYLEIDRGIADLFRDPSEERRGEALPAARADPAFSLVAIARAARAWPDAADAGWDTTDVRVACGMLGSLAISTGPGAHWIDECGLTDAFIARQPFSNGGKTWRPGHYARPIPEGYVDAVKAGDASRVVDPELRRQLEQVWSVIR